MKGDNARSSGSCSTHSQLHLWLPGRMQQLWGSCGSCDTGGLATYSPGGGGASTSVYKEQGGFSVHISAWLALLQAASAACAGFLLVGTVGWRVGGPVGAC